VLINKAAIDLYPNNPAMLWRFIRNFGFNFEQSGDIQRSLNGQSGKRFFSPSHLLVVDRDQVVIIDREQDWRETAIDANEQTVYLGPWSLSIADVSSEATVRFERSPDESTAVLDGTLLQFPLVWRKWRPGDHFHPLGLGHSKKLSDFFIDQKLSIADKDQATVLECNGRIAWVVGYRIDDRFKITDATTQRVSLKVSLL
jgi:tRNA(Ile)-lysidine synthase